MIFVTVGTHEQSFNRLVEYMDNWAAKHDEEVVIQTGYSDYEPKHCKWSKLYSYQVMLKMVNDARIVITHGGPSSFIMPLQVGKVPIVVPRRKEFNEHVNDHQVDFGRQVVQRQGNIIFVESIDDVGDAIENYQSIVDGMKHNLSSNNEKFCRRFEEIVNELLGD